MFSLSTDRQTPSRKPLIHSISLLLALALSSQAAAQNLYANNPEATRLAQDIALRQGLDPIRTVQEVGQAEFIPAVQKLMRPARSAAAKNWRAYRARFIEPVRINAGVRFWNENRATLNRAAKEYGVPAEIIVGILGVESIYGRDMGNFRAMDALSTLSFDFPTEHSKAAERTTYFRGELEGLLALSKKSGSDPFTFVGSYAGALGMPQFMPTNVIKYGVDYDRDGVVDLRHSAADTIGSVANYFVGFGWKPGMPTHYPVQFSGSQQDFQDLMGPDILPTFSVNQFAAKGATIPEYAQGHRGPLALVELLNGPNDPQYVAGTENFYCITRYNWSSYYAMAVIELGQTIKARMGM